MKVYRVSGRRYTEEEVIAVHAMWQGILDRDNLMNCVELALTMIGNDGVYEHVRNNEQDVIEGCKQDLLEWGVWQDECLSQNSLLDCDLVADKLKEMYASYCAGGDEQHERL